MPRLSQAGRAGPYHLRNPGPDISRMSNPFEQARDLFLEGVRLHEAGQYGEAEQRFQAALELVPGRPSTLANLGATRIKLGKPHEAIEALEQALSHDADAVDALQYRAVALNMLGRHEAALADWTRVVRVQPDPGTAWLLHGETLQQLDRHEEALASYDAALARNPRLGQAWSRRGALLKDMGLHQEAAVAFQQAIDCGDDLELNRYFLAALNGRDPPASPPRRYVEVLFDGYAEKFDEHLVEILNYQAHRVLVDQVAALARRFEHALDLGCGTGLCGPLVKPMAQGLDGVDVSGNMLAKAEALGVYDRLVRDDAAHYLATTSHRYDLALSADVFIYVGALEAVFDGVARVMKPGGVFCFSVELASDEQDFVLRPSQRYAHSERYLRALALRHGFEIRSMLRHPIREDQRQPIPGLFVCLGAV
jgi:predicted TPR repeat methyltransferase